jgi:hypothetical protein
VTWNDKGVTKTSGSDYNGTPGYLTPHASANPVRYRIITLNGGYSHGGRPRQREHRLRCRSERPLRIPRNSPSQFDEPSHLQPAVRQGLGVLRRRPHPRMTIVPPGFLILLVFLLSSALVSAQSADPLLGDEFSITGDASFDAPLETLAGYSRNGVDWPWQFTATQVDVQEIYRDDYENVSGVDIEKQPVTAGNLQSIHTPSSASVSVLRAGDFWVLPGTTNINFIGDGVMHVTPSFDKLQFPNRLSENESTWPATDGSGLLTATQTAGDGSIQLTGDIELLVFNTELKIDGTTYWSGQREQPAADQEGTPATGSRIQVLHVWLTDATLEIPSNDLDQLDASVRSASLQGKGIASIMNPNHASDFTALGDRLNLDGVWSLDVSRANDQLRFSNLASDAAALDGQSYALEPSAGLNGWWWLLLILPIAITAIMYRPPPAVLVYRMEKQLRAKDYARVAGTTVGRLLRSRFSSKASLYRSTALLAIREFQEASLFLASLSRRQRPDPATYHFLCAHAAAGIGSTQSAKNHIRDCLDIAPSYYNEVMATPSLKQVMAGAPTPTEPNIDDYV